MKNCDCRANTIFRQLWELAVHAAVLRYGIPSSMHKQTTEVTASPVSRMYGATWYLYVLRYYLLLQAYGKLRMGDGGHV
jgi:hypothetical protein